jgi:hypothetical protein
MKVAGKIQPGSPHMVHRPLRLSETIVARLAGAVVLLAGQSLWASPPAVSRISPLAVRPGAVTQFQLQGTGLGEFRRLWTTFPVACSKAASSEDGKSFDCQFTLPRDAQVGIEAFRVVTTGGVSGLKMIMVDDLPTIAQVASNHSPVEAQQIILPVAIDGACRPLKSDYYALEGRAGQWLTVEVVSQRLGFALDSVLRLLDAEGNELARSDDEPGIGGDSRLSHEITADGVCYLELRDVSHQGGDNFQYRLRVGRFPLATVVYPMGGQVGSIATLHLHGPHVEGLSPLRVQLAADGPAPKLLSAPFPGGQGSGFVLVDSGSEPEELEVEPNNQQPEANPIEVPCAINGSFSVPGDCDQYSFTGAKGERLAFCGLTRQLGSPADLLLRVKNREGKVLQEMDDAGSSEAALHFVLPEEGTYLLSVNELLGRAGQIYTYRIVVGNEDSGFELAAEADTITVPHGGVFQQKVTAKRHNYGGPIELSLEGVGNHIQLQGQTILKDKTETTVTATVSDQIQPGELKLVRIIGKPADAGRTGLVEANTTLALRKVLPDVAALPGGLDGVIAIGVAGPFSDFYKIQVEETPIYFPQLAGVSVLKVLLERLQKKFKDPISLSVEGLPEGVKAEVKPVEGSQVEYLVTLTGPPEIALGNHSIRITAQGTYQLQPQQAVIEDLTLQVVKPLVVTIEPAGPIAPGGRQKVGIRVRRFGEEKHPVVLTWSEAPSGILVPIGSIVPAHAAHVEVEIAASETASVDTSGRLRLIASTKFKDQEIVVESVSATMYIGGNAATDPTTE